MVWAIIQIILFITAQYLQYLQFRVRSIDLIPE